MDDAPATDLLLSVLVPIYMRDVSDLLVRLSTEIRDHGLIGKVDIHLADDYSPNRELAAINRQAVQLAGVPWIRYEDLPRNLGRSAIRNHLGSMATGRHLLFLDCDVIPDHTDFLRKYLDCFAAGADAVCGGISYKQIPTPRPEELFYVYTSCRNDVKAAALRNRNPAKHLLTGNVAIRKALFMRMPFDTAFVGHGYEDTEWGLRLTVHHQITHVDNTVTHLGLVPCSHFIDRTAESTKNYVKLAIKHEERFRSSPMMRISRLATAIPPEILGLWGGLLKRLAHIELLPMRIRYMSFQGMKVMLFCSTLRKENRHMKSSRTTQQISGENT